MSQSTSGRGPTPSASGSGQRRPTMDEGLDKGVKIAQPDLYYGERDKLESWLTQISLYLAFMGDKIPAAKHATFAITYLRGRAQKWVEPFLKKYMEEPDEPENADIKLWMESAARFRVEIRRMFGPSNEANAATRIIQHLTQRKSASEYSTQFQQYAAKTDWDDTALMVMYRRGLKDNVKDELMRCGGVLDTLDGLIEEAIEIDDKLFERSMEKRHDGGTSGMGRSTFFSKSKNYRHDKRDQRDPYGHTPMELDFTERKPKGKHFKGKRQHGGKKAITCYSCGKPGHMARDCRTKNMVYRPQLNVLEKVPVQDDGTPERISPAWDEVEADINSWYDKQRQMELDEESENADSDFTRKFNAIIRERTREDAKESAHAEDSSNAQGKRPEQDQEESDPEWEDALSTTETDWEEVQPTPGSPMSREEEESKEPEDKMIVWDDTLDRDYRMDDFHLEHSDIHWTWCANEFCPTHEPVRRREKGEVYLPECGVLNWKYCTHDECQWHLTRKRTFQHFPGYGEQWCKNFRGELARDPNTEECHMLGWYTCLHDKCQKHMRQKQIAGFLTPEEGKD